MLNSVSTTPKYVVGGYLRISLDDDADIESNSIKSQRDLIKRHISGLDGFHNASFVEYVDDGISGSHTERNGYQRLLADVARGDVDCIVVKDLSRIGRDMLEVDDLLMNHLIMLNVRFISINNGYDSLMHPLSNLELAFINLTNQHYSRDLGLKSKSAKLTKQKRGEYLGHAPFGYVKSDTERNKLIVDDEAAGYVRLIYSLAVEGRKTAEIARALNAQGIPCPSVYKVRNGWTNRWTKITVNPDQCFWSDSTVRVLIKNETYTGKTISRKSEVTEFGKLKTMPRAREEWIIVPDTHEPLVSEDDFKKAQMIFEKKKKAYPEKPDNIFMGKLKCSACGHTLKRTDSLNPGFRCVTARYTSNYGCQAHTILQSDIEKTVIASIRAYAAALVDREKAELAVLERDKASAVELETKIREENKAIQLLESSVTGLYMSFADEKITEAVYLHKKSAISDTVAQKRRAVEDMNERLTAKTIGLVAVGEALSVLEPLLDIETLDKESVNLLIDKIHVHGSNDIEIVWNGRYGS